MDKATLTEDMLPRHNASLLIYHNLHKDYYEDVDTYIRQLDVEPDEWVAKGEEDRAIERDEIWEMQWYPDTPVGFFKVYAASFPALVKWMQDNKERYS